MHSYFALGALPTPLGLGDATKSDATAIGRFGPDPLRFWAWLQRLGTRVPCRQTVVFSSTRSTNQ